MATKTIKLTGVFTQNEDHEVECKRCGKTVMKSDTEWSYDCHGIVFRRCCPECIEIIETGDGYDGHSYTSAEENIDYEY